MTKIWSRKKINDFFSLKKTIQMCYYFGCFCSKDRYFSIKNWLTENNNIRTRKAHSDQNMKKEIWSITFTFDSASRKNLVMQNSKTKSSWRKSLF